jgi:hypothetical protein
MKWLVAIALIIAATVVALIAFSGSNKFYTHRYRLSVAADVNGSTHIGSSVIEVTWFKQPQNLPIPVPEFVANVRGEAAVIDLGDGRALVALLGPADPLDLPTPLEFVAMQAYGLADSPASFPLIAKQTGSRGLEGKNIPAFVIFADRAKPDTARIAKPHGPDGELAPGVKLLGATIEITSDPVSNSIGEKLPWWSMNGRPAAVAWRAWLEGNMFGSSVEPETLFRRGAGKG